MLDALRSRRALLAAELHELAQPVLEPGVQMQFGKRAGDHTSDAVIQMTRTITSGKLVEVAAEIDRALAKAGEGSYGMCDSCGEEIPEERLEALPWATRCVKCKATSRS
jgi:DnaK suppressor protein